MAEFSDYANAINSGLQLAGSAASFAQSVGIGSKRQMKRALEYNNKLQEQAFEYNKRLAAYQNDIALSNWNLENQYNTPEAQMQRFLAAGLNPNLVYGAGASSGNAGNIGTPTVGGSQDPSSIGDMVTRMRAQRVNAAQTSLAMMSGAADLFGKLMTIRGSIDAQNAQNAGKKGLGEWTSEYYKWLNTPDNALGAATAKVHGWNAEQMENILRERIADYKLGLDREPVQSDEFGNTGVPVFAQELNSALTKTQTEIAYKGLLNGFQEVINKIAGHPIYGKAAMASKEAEILDKKLMLSGIDFLIRNRMYNWAPYKNVGGILSSLWPKFTFSFGKSTKTFNKTY